MSNEQPAPTAVAELLARQAQLRAWIEQLDVSVADVPTHVADRVRSDYEKRLAELVEQLRTHEGVLREDADRQQDALHRAGEERQLAEDGLAEGKLRNRLGEWSTAEWETRRTELEGVVSAAAAREEQLRGELERLEELLFEMAGASEQDTRPEEEDYGFQPGIDPALTAEEGTLPFEEDTEIERGTLPMEPPTEGDPAAYPTESRPPMVGGTLPMGREPVGADPETRPSTGVKCMDCGYTNDSTAWYCGVCGVNLT